MPDQEGERLVGTQPELFVRGLLEEYGLAADPLLAAGGWSNQVWLAPAHVVRLSSGRFRDALAHEAAVLRLLPAVLPHARVFAHGRVGRREWMILERAAGRTLLDQWHVLTLDERREAVRQLGTALRALHAVPLPAGLHNPWLDDALAPGGDIRNVYHAPPASYLRLLDAASQLVGADRSLLAEVEALISERLEAFTEDTLVLVHADAHFANVLWENGQVTALLDFETARPAAADLELDALLRFAREPRPYQAPGGLPGPSREDMLPVPGWLADVYPGLFAHPRLATRLVVYEALWQLVQLHHYSPGNGVPDPPRQLRVLLAEGERLFTF